MDDRRVTLAEGAVRFSVTASLNASPGSQPGFYNPQMALNRSMCVIELQAAVEAGAHELHGAADAGLGAADRSVRVLDCFSGSGALALRLAKEVVDGAARPVEVTAGDLNPHCADLIAQNAQLNGLGVRRVCARLEGASNAAAATADALPAPPSADGGSAGPSSAPFTVAVADARALLLLSEPYEHVHLDPFGSCAPFLDTAASCAPNGGLISLTATDTAALFANYPAVALRTYGCHLQRSDPNWREAGARALVGALATAAARHGRGIVPLHTTCAAHFVHCTVRIRRGASAADASAAEVRLCCGHARAVVFFLTEDSTPLPAGARGDDARRREARPAMDGATRRRGFPQKLRASRRRCRAGSLGHHPDRGDCGARGGAGAGAAGRLSRLPRGARPSEGASSPPGQAGARAQGEARL
jgi:tRNA G26 N,N-dimethylase Trm1